MLVMSSHAIWFFQLFSSWIKLCVWHFSNLWYNFFSYFNDYFYLLKNKYFIALLEHSSNNKHIRIKLLQSISHCWKLENSLEQSNFILISTSVKIESHFGYLFENCRIMIFIPKSLSGDYGRLRMFYITYIL
jgi:hypothetical protein